MNPAWLVRSIVAERTMAAMDHPLEGNLIPPTTTQR